MVLDALRGEVERSMSVALSFTEAVSTLSLHEENADAFDDVDRLERFVLDHTPTTREQAASMLLVAIINLKIGGRCDGRDLKAVEAVRTFLSD